jgi:putative SOS response-associated peptidase YedK
MCGRYVIEWLPDEITERFQLRRIPASLFESFNAAPTQELPVVVETDAEGRVLRPMRWGLIPRWSKPGEKGAPAPFNARAESVLEKAMFRSLVAKKRCLVPANGYFEWKPVGGRKQPYLFTLKDQELFAFAGLYDEGTGVDGEPVASYTVLTTDANTFASAYHHRMPVILRREDEEEWASPEQTDAHAVTQLLRQYPADLMEARPVSPAINNVRNNDRSLIVPEDEEPEASEEEESHAGSGHRRLI